MANQVGYVNIPIFYFTFCSLITTLKCKEKFITKADELKKLDDEIFQSIHYPSSLHGWEEVLQNIDIYINSLQLKVEELANSVQESIDIEAESIWNNDMPKFITQDLDETMYSIIIKVTEEQIERFHNMQKAAAKLWKKFGEIIMTRKKNMKV